MINVQQADRWVSYVFTQISKSLPNTAKHGDKSGKLFSIIATPMGFSSETIAIYRLIMKLHDLGKLWTPKFILLKETPLSKIERRVIELHPILGLLHLNFPCGPKCPVEFKRLATMIILLHHERWGGGGYPLGLKKISPLMGAVAIGDVWDAMAQQRPYRKKPYAPEKIWDIIRGKTNDNRRPERHHPLALEAAELVLPQLFEATKII